MKQSVLYVVESPDGEIYGNGDHDFTIFLSEADAVAALKDNYLDECGWTVVRFVRPEGGQ